MLIMKDVITFPLHLLSYCTVNGHVCPHIAALPDHPLLKQGWKSSTTEKRCLKGPVA